MTYAAVDYGLLFYSVGAGGIGCTIMLYIIERVKEVMGYL